MRKPVGQRAVLAALLAGAAALAQRARSRRSEREVWKTATREPDLR